ncbi:MAG: YggS family pyridoxal phosphate-dependent enzyme [Bacteroidetes bacterium]|nr:YggS family pyridoxal phosphate-dependent enzyme [Bacteroidota bacterium]
MTLYEENYFNLTEYLKPYKATLVAVSKTRKPSEIMVLYDLGQRDFGENYVQELLEKKELLPKDIRWHFIGHLQSNKVKQIIPFIHLIHSIDSLNLLKEINKQSRKLNIHTPILLQAHIAREETKFGFDPNELETIIRVQAPEFTHIHLKGLMGMASLTDDKSIIQQEFEMLSTMFEKYRKQSAELNVLSMGMSGDYQIALNYGSNMVRVGSLLFGHRS